MNCEICGGSALELYSCSLCATLVCDADWIYYGPDDTHYCENCVLELEEDDEEDFSLESYW